jgi:excisionase family DNA binding protein
MKITRLAKELNVSRQTIYDWIKAGKIKTKRNFGGTIYIPNAEIQRLIGGSVAKNLSGETKESDHSTAHQLPTQEEK